MNKQMDFPFIGCLTRDKTMAIAMGISFRIFSSIISYQFGCRTLDGDGHSNHFCKGKWGFV
jgi:hypothetical protein